MNTRIQFFLFLYLIGALLTPVYSSDIAKEQRWADQVVDGLFDGEPVFLQADGLQFLSIFTQAVNEVPDGAVIILHGRGIHPDWPQVISPLRTQLPEKNWTTLSLQMPVLNNDAKLEEYVPLFEEIHERINAGIQFLEKKGIKKIALLGHSMGAGMATYYMANTKDPRVNAVIGVGMSGDKPELRRVMDNSISLKKLTMVPVLDIYGSEDIALVLDSVQGRANAIKEAGNPYSRQVKIEGNNHFHEGHEVQLVNVITEWLGKATGKNDSGSTSLVRK